MSHLKEEPKPCDFPNRVAPLEFSLDRATRALLFCDLVEHRGVSPTELQRQDLRKMILFLGLLSMNLRMSVSFLLSADFPSPGIQLS